MRLQVIDDSVHFTCGSCTACCDQPWRTLIEESKVAALKQHDFSSYKQLAGKDFYRKSKAVPPGFFELAKGEGTKCLFLDNDGLCIIHKELGAEAKPKMCQQFPLIVSRSRLDDRVSVNYGCPSVQEHRGKPLRDQADDIARLVPLSDRDSDPSVKVKLVEGVELSADENEAVHARAMQIFSVCEKGSIWQRFADLLAMLLAVGKLKGQDLEGDGSPSLAQRLRADEPLPGIEEAPAVCAYEKATDVPMPARMLFAATLYPDAIPGGSTASMSFGQRLTLIPKLMSLATLSGTYASRLLRCNVPIKEVLSQKVAAELDGGADDLLLRYFRSRFWQQIGTTKDLSIVSSIHQHILDFNAIVFFARVAAHEQGNDRLSKPLIAEALTKVEFHLANQYRLYQKTLKGWLLAQLGNPQVVLASLRLMALTKSPAATSEIPAGGTSAELIP